MKQFDVMKGIRKPMPRPVIRHREKRRDLYDGGFEVCERCGCCSDRENPVVLRGDKLICIECCAELDHIADLSRR